MQGAGLPPMNLLYLHCHDAGRWLAPGGPVPTPGLRALADHSVAFTNAHSTAPTCTPSRVALLTGAYAHEAGVLGLAHRGFALRRPDWHLAAFLGGQGWETALAGIQHEFAAGDPQLPYACVLPAAGPERDQATAAAAAAWLRAPQRRERPFFLACGFFWPHRPFPDPGPKPADGWPAPPAPLPDAPATRADFAAFAAAAMRMDDAAGEVLRALDDAGLRDSTLVIFTTDHGPAFPGMKCGLRDAGTGVTLLVRPPGGTPGRTCGALASHLDIFPTVCDYAGLPPPPHCRGQSLRPALVGRDWPGHAELFAEVTFHAAYEPQRSVRTATHKLIRRFDPDRRPVLPNVDDGPSKDHWVAGGLPAAWAETELYDLVADPGETVNLAGRAEIAAVEADLRGRLDAWMRATRDPLLDGPVAAPPGAVVTPRTAFSP